MAFNFTPSGIFSALIAFNDVVSNFFAVDVVGIFDSESLNQVFTNARPMRAEVQETSRIMQHPVETGAILSDHRITNPIRISITFILNQQFYDADYQQMKAAFVNATTFNVQTRTGVYANMIIADMPHRESTEMFDAVDITLNFQEVQFVVPVSVSTAPAPVDYSPSNPGNSNTVQSGQKNTSLNAVTAPQQSNIANYLKN